MITVLHSYGNGTDVIKHLIFLIFITVTITVFKKVKIRLLLVVMNMYSISSGEINVLCTICSGF